MVADDRRLLIFAKSLQSVKSFVEIDATSRGVYSDFNLKLRAASASEGQLGYIRMYSFPGLRRYMSRSD